MNINFKLSHIGDFAEMLSKLASDPNRLFLPVFIDKSKVYFAFNANDVNYAVACDLVNREEDLDCLTSQIGSLATSKIVYLEGDPV